MHKKLILLAVLGLLSIGCGEKKTETPAVRPDSSLVRVGTDATYPPFETVNVKTGEPDGFDIDIMKSIARINNWNLEFIITPFDGIISALKNEKFDCIISAMTITPERAQNVSFSEPYYLAGQIVAVPLQDSTIQSVNDLKGKRIGVQLGTTGERFAGTLKDIQVFSFDNIGAAFIDMENGRIDAVINDWPTTWDFIRRKGTAKMVGNLLSEEHYGIAVRKGDTVLLNKINDAFKIMKSSGEYERLAQKWFLQPDTADEGK
jgi:polar amino acid transport system substrate-binding protein